MEIEHRPHRLGAPAHTLLFPVRPVDEAACHRDGFLAGSLWKVTRLGSALSVPCLQNTSAVLCGFCWAWNPGRISGSLARRIGLLAVVAPHTLAARLAWLLWGVKITPMGVWKVVQRCLEPIPC